MRVWVNGEVKAQAAAVLSVFDHGLTVGHGVFETIKVVNGIPFALTRHLNRLVSSACGLGLPEPDLDMVRHAVREVLAANDSGGLARLRITYTGGPSPFGYQRGSSGPSLIVAVAPIEAPSPSATVMSVPWPRNEHAATAGLKTISYAENVVAAAYATVRGVSEALFANTVGNLCEGAGSNIFLALRGRLITPPLSAGCLAGVTRALVLEWAEVIEEDIPLTALAEADEVFLTSATRDIQPVGEVNGRLMASVPGVLTHQAMKTFAKRSTLVCDP